MDQLNTVALGIFAIVLDGDSFVVCVEPGFEFLNKAPLSFGVS